MQLLAVAQETAEKPVPAVAPGARGSVGALTDHIVPVRTSANGRGFGVALALTPPTSTQAPPGIHATPWIWTKSDVGIAAVGSDTKPLGVSVSAAAASTSPASSIARLPMFDHITLRVADLPVAIRALRPALRELEVEQTTSSPSRHAARTSATLARSSGQPGFAAPALHQVATVARRIRGILQTPT
jgi:hypothetical protein